MCQRIVRPRCRAGVGLPIHVHSPNTIAGLSGYHQQQQCDDDDDNDDAAGGSELALVRVRRGQQVRCERLLAWAEVGSLSPRPPGKYAREEFRAPLHR
jgi:hypothetical protein